MAVTYAVMNENTLGYLNDVMPGRMGVLHGSPTRGGHDWRNGSVLISPIDTLRPATLADFETYRVSPLGHLTPLLKREPSI